MYRHRFPSSHVPKALWQRLFDTGNSCNINVWCHTYNSLVAFSYLCHETYWHSSSLPLCTKRPFRSCQKNGSYVRPHRGTNQSFTPAWARSMAEIMCLPYLRETIHDLKMGMMWKLNFRPITEKSMEKNVTRLALFFVWILQLLFHPSLAWRFSV